MSKQIARAALLALALLTTACPKGKNTGTLVVNINGLPAGVAASVMVTSQGYSQMLTASDSVTIPAAIYVVTANIVTSGSNAYTPKINGSPALVIDGGTATVTVLYALTVTPPTTGTLQLNVSGLPSGASGSVNISGPSNFTETGTAMITAVQGTYTITAANVTVGSLNYIATISGSPAIVTTGNTTTVSVVYAVAAPTTGTLQVNISGLPSGVSADVLITGPSNLSLQATSTETLDDLATGTYTITAANVISGQSYGATISPSPTVIISAGGSYVVNVVYAVTTGTLQVNISGLPSGVLASVNINPGGITDTATSSHTLQPGTYTITAANVISGQSYGATISPSPTVIISAGSSYVVNVVYAVTTGTLQVNISGLPSGVLASVNINPGGITDTATSSHTLQPGTYTITAANVISGQSYGATISPSPTVIISAGGSYVVNVVYAVTTGTLQVNISGLPSGVLASVNINPGGITDTATSSHTLQPGTYTITAANVISGQSYGATISPSPTVIISAGGSYVVNVVYAVTTGTLQVNISGLPSGVLASVNINPGGITDTATSSHTLQPGTYTITAANVISGQSYGATISPSPTVIISAGGSYVVNVVYAVTTGTLQVNISGLPSGVLASVNINPGGITDTATSSHTLQPGTYTITAANVISGAATYAATITPPSVILAAGGTYTVNVVYAVTGAPGTLVVNITGGEFQTGAVTVSGPNGYTDSITAVNTTLSGLAPGAYTVSAANIIDGPTYAATVSPSPAMVTSGNSTTVTVAYAQVNGTANVVITMPGGVEAGTTYFTNVFLLHNGSGSHVNGYNTNSTLAIGTYTILANPVTISGIVYTANVTTSPFNVTANATTVVTVDYEFPAPVITSVTQNYANGTPQYVIAIDGTGFANDGHTVANIDGVPCTGVTVSAFTTFQQLQCTVPTPHATGFVDVTVTTSEGTTSANNAFQYEYWSVDYYSLNQALGDAAPIGGMVLGPDNNIWFTDENFAKIGTLNIATGTITECALPMTPSEADPRDIAAGADGNLWVADYSLDVIYRISPATFISSIGTAGACTIASTDTFAIPIPAFRAPNTQGGHPLAITSGPDGNIWFTLASTVNGTFDQIGTINVTTGVMSEFALTTQGASIWGITTANSGSLYFGKDASFGTSVGTITTSGIIGSLTVSAPSEQQWMVVGPDGNLWYDSSSNLLSSITPNGILTLSEAAVSFGGENRVISDPRGAVWYAGGSSLGRFDTTALTHRSYPIFAGAGVAIDTNGDVWSLCVQPAPAGQSGQNSLCRLHF